MRKLSNLAIGIVLTVLAATFLSKRLMPTPETALPETQSISIDEIHRSIDRSALPVLQVKDPI